MAFRFPSPRSIGPCVQPGCFCRPRATPRPDQHLFVSHIPQHGTRQRNEGAGEGSIVLCTDLGSREIMSCRVVVVERHPDSARRCGQRGHGRDHGARSGVWVVGGG